MKFYMHLEVTHSVQFDSHVNPISCACRHPGHQNVSKTNHTNEDRAFMCEVCGKAFRSSTHLKRHVEIHTGKNKYQCHLCLRFLNRKDQLKKHIGGRRCKPMKSSPPPPPEQPVMPVPEIMYRCIVCKNMFTTKVDYINHKASHAQEEFEQATQCPYPRPEENFVGASGDVPVKLTAPEEGRVYPCPNCPLVFEEQTTLNRHFLTHTGQKCFHCRFCHKQFAARRGLVFHMAHSCKQKPAGFRLDDLVKDSQEESEPDAATTPQLAYNAAPMVPLQPGPVLPPNARLPPAKDPINSFPESHHSREPCPDPTLQPQQVSYQAQQFASDDLFPYKSSYNQNMQYNSHIPAKPTATYTTKDNNLRYHDKNIGYGDKSNMLGYADKQSVMEYSSKDTMIMGNTITYGTGDNSVSFVAKDNIVDYETHTSHTVLNYGDTKPTNMDYVNKPGALDFLDKSIDYLRQVTDYTPKVADASYPSWSTNASISVSQEGQNLQQNLGIAVSETGHVLSGDLMMAHSGHTAQSMQAIHSQSIVSVPTATPMGATSGTLTVSEPHVYSAEIPYPVQVLPVTSSCPEQTQLPQQPSVPMQTYTQLTSFIQPPTTTLTNVPSQPPIMQSATLQNTHIQSDPLSTFPAPVVATHNPHDIITAAHQPSSSPQRPSNTITTSMQSVQVDSSTRTTKKESRSKSNDEPRNAMDCPTCGAVFKQVYYFIKHFETSKCAKVGGPVTCKVCGDETVPFEDYVKHVRRHDGLDTYTCSLCFKMYTSSLRYEKHRTQCEAFMKSMGTVKSDSKDDESEISSDKKQVDTDQIGPETVQNYPEVNIAEEDSETLSLQQLEAVGISTLASIESRTLGRNPQILQQGTSSSHPGLEDAENPNESHSERRLLHKAAPVDLGNGTRGFESESSWWELGTGSNFGFQCQVAGCAAILSSKYHLMRHVKSVHSGDEKVVCDICNKTYSSKHSLNTHLLTHSQEKKHKCRYCNTRFRLAATLKRHERRHTGERPHKCPVCTQCFIDISELNRHLAVHNVENPFTCAVCGQAFPRKKMLIYHVKVHRGPRKAKPIHACTACGKRFTSKRSLSFHMRTHTGEQPYECEFCHERFTWLSSYHRHVGQHMGRVHTCHVCHKNFSSLPGLKEHMVGHSDRRDFSCHICGKTFAKRKCWRQHLRVHEGKRHVCTVCGSAFSEVYYLNRHMKIHAPPQHGAMWCWKNDHQQRASVSRKLLIISTPLFRLDLH